MRTKLHDEIESLRRGARSARASHEPGVARELEELLGQREAELAQLSDWLEEAKAAAPKPYADYVPDMPWER